MNTTDQMTPAEPDTPVDGPSHETLVSAYRDRAAAIGALLAAGGADGADRATPCEGWAVRDLVAHLIGTQRDFLIERGLAVPTVAGTDPTADWAAHTAAVRSLLEDPAVGAREYDGYFGRTTVAGTMANFYGWDLLVHRWDLARALGADERLSESELDQVEAALPGFGDQLYGAGICAGPVDVGEDQPRQVRVLARLGRDAR